MKTNLASLRVMSAASKTAGLLMALLGTVPVWSQSPYQPNLSKVDGTSLLNANGSWGQSTSAWSQTSLITATGTPVRSSNRVTGITITNGGAGYIAPPIVTISGGNGAGATATASISAEGRVVSIVMTNQGSGYTANPTVTIAPPAPGGVGSSVRFNNDITNNRLINLDGNRTVGRMQLGDLSSGSYYTIAQGSGGSLIFDNAGNGGGAFFNRVTGHSSDNISAPIILNDQLNVRNTTNRVTFSGSITGNGNLLTSYGNGTLAITGDNTGTGLSLWLWNRGTSNTNAQIELGAATGNAVSGDIRIGSASRGMSGHAVLQLLLGRSNLDQISDTSTIIFDSFSGSGRNNYFKLMGGNETVGRIVDLGSLAVIENRESETVNTAAKLTIAGDLDSFVSGFIRDKSGNNLQQADASGTPGSNALSLRKEGSGVLTLKNSNISFSGGLEIAGGTVILQQTTNFRSDVQNDGTLIFDTGTLGTTGTWNFIKSFADPDGSGSQLAPEQQALIISGSGSVEKTGNGILNLGGTVARNQNIGGSLTVRNGTLNLTGAGAGATVGAGLIVDGDVGLNRNVNLLGRTTITGGIDATGRYNNTGSSIKISGTAVNYGDQQTSFYENGVATINGDIKLNFMSLVLESNYSIAKTTTGGASGNKITVTNSASIVVGMRVTGSGIPAGTTVTAIDPVTRVVTLSNSATSSSGSNLTFSYSSHSDGVINGSPTSLTVIGRPNAIGSSAVNNGRLVLNNSQYSNNTNRLPDSTPIVLKGGAIDFVNDGTANAFSESLGALSISQGQAQIVGYQAGTGGTSSLRFASLSRNYGATVEFAGLERTSSGGVNNVTNALGTNSRNRILITGGVTMDDGIIGGWAWANNEFVKYDNTNGVTRLTPSDYLTFTGSGTNSMATWTYDDNVKLSLAGTTALSVRRAINSLNFQYDIGSSAAGRSFNLNANSILSIESGGLLSSHGNNTINGNGTTGYLTVGSAANQSKDLVAIVGTTAGTASANALTLNTAIRDFELRLTSAVTMTAGSTTMSIPANTAPMLQVGMEVSHPNLPAGTTVVSVTRSASGATTITLSNPPISGALGTVNASRAVVFKGGSVGLTKSGPGTLILATSLTNTYTGPTIINNGILRLRNASNLGADPTTFQAAHLQLNGGILQFGQDQRNGAFNDPDLIYEYNITDGKRGVTFGEAGGRLEVGHINPIPTPVSTANLAVVPIVNVTITNPIHADGVVELAVRNNINNGAYNTLTLGNATSANYYGGGIKTEGLFNGVTNINGNNYVNGLFMEGGRVTFSGNNDFSGSIRVLSGQLTLNGANTYNGSANFSEAITIGAATVTLGRNDSLGTSGFKVVMTDQAQLQFNGTSQTLLSLSGTALSTISNGYSRPDSSSAHRPSTLTVDLAVNEIFNGRLDNGGSSALNLTKTGNGRLSLTNNDSNFSGTVLIQQGVLDVTSISFASGQSALGRGISGAASEIVIDGGALSLSPRGQQVTDRSFSIGAGVNAATIVANGINQAARVILGADLIVGGDSDIFGIDRIVSAPVGFVGNGSRTLTLSGVNTGDNQFMLELGDKSASEVTSLLKTGPGTWELGMAGRYSGETTVQEGTLALSANGAAGTSAIPVTANRDTDQMTITGLSLPNGVELNFPLFVNTTLPNGLNTNTRYYVVQASGTAFKVAATPGGTPIDFTGNGQNVFVVPNIQPISSTVPDAVADTFTGNLPNGTRLVFGTQIPVAGAAGAANTNGQLPTPIITSKTYYVRDATGTTFKVSDTLGGAAINITNNGAGSIYYMAELYGNTSSGINVVGGRLELRNVDYMTPETVTFQGGSLTMPRNTTARWAGNFDVQVNTSFTLAANSELILDGNLLGSRQITQLGEGTVRLRGESIMPSLPESVTNTMDNSRRVYSLQAGTLILDYSLNNNSKLVDNATLVLGGSRRGGILRLEGGDHEEIVGALSLSTGANQIYRDSGSSIIRLNNISRAEGASLYFDLTQIARVDILNVNDILGGWAIIREAPVQAAWVLPGTVSKKFYADANSDTLKLPITQGASYMAEGLAVVLETTGTLPAPLQVGVTYYVADIIDTRNFKLATTPFGLPIDLTDNGTGSSSDAQHTIKTTGAIKRPGQASLIFTARADRYPGVKGNNIFKVQIERVGTSGAITSQLIGPTSNPTPANPLTYKIITTSTASSATAIAQFVNSDANASPYLTLAVSGADSTPDAGSYGPGLLTSGTDDSGTQAIGWAKNGTNSADGLVQPTTSYEIDNWVKNKNTDVTKSATNADGSETSTLRFANRTPTTLTLNEDGLADTVHTLQTGAILVSPTVGANDSIITGLGSLTTANNGNLRNFIIHQYNEAGDLVIGVDMVDRKPVIKHGRLTSGNRRILTGLETTADLEVGNVVRFTSNATSFGPPQGSSSNTNSAVIARIDPDGHTVELDRETLVNDSRQSMTFTLTNGTTVARLASHQSTTTQNRILGVITTDAGGNEIVSTADIYIGMRIEGPGIPPGAIVDFIVNDADIRINTNHHFVDLWSEFTLTPQVGLEKLGGGTLVLSGDNSYSGITYLAGGTVRATKLTDGGVVGSLGAATNSTGNLNFNGGTLLYVGENTSTNRGFTVTDYARISVGHEKTTAIFGGDVSGSDRLEKAGPGTLQMSGNASLSELKIDEGKLLVQAVDRSAAPGPGSGSYSQSNLSGGSLGSLRLGGGKLEVRGTQEGNTTLTFGGSFYVDEGASEVRAISVLGYDPGNLSLGAVPRTTTVNLMGGEETTTVVRSAGGSVLFVEAPESGAAAANIVLNTSTFERAQVLPWAVYQDITNVLTPGVNNFASISLLNGAVVSADSQSAYDLGDFFMNADNWGTVEPGSSIDASEGGRVEIDLENGVNSVAGVKQLTVDAALASGFANLTVGMSVFGPGMPAGTQIVALDTPNFIVYLNNAATLTTTGGTYLFTKSRTFYGTLTDDREVNTLRYYSAEDSTITIGTGKTLKLTSGAILVGSNVRGGNKSILGTGNITGVVESGSGSDLLIHNYNPAAPFTIGANIVDNVIVSQLGKGASAVGVGSVFAGVDRIFIATAAFDFFNQVTPGMEVTGPGVPDGTSVISKNTVENSITISRAATSDLQNQVYTFRSRTNFVQTGTGTTILSGANTYTGNTYVHGGVLRLNSANAIPGGISAGASASTSSHIIVKDGVIGLGSENFTRALGTEANQVEFKGSGGFAAYGADRIVNLGNSSKKLRFGNDGFVTDGSSLIFGAVDATHKVIFENPIDLGSFSQAVRVVNGPADIEGELAGVLSGLGKLVKFGSGSLRLSAQNTLEGGIEIAEGRLVIANVPNVLGLGSGAVTLGTSLTNTSKGAVTELAVEGGTVDKAIQVGNVNSPGSEWLGRGTADSTNGLDVGAHASSAIVNGNPAIAYYDAANGDLKYVRAADVRGISWLPPVTLASSGDVGQFPSLSIINGFPAVSYYDATNGTLCFIQSTDVSGVAWRSPVIVDAQPVNAIGVQSDGKIIVGGTFIEFDGVTNTRLARLGANGVLDTGFSVTVNGEVRAIAVQSDDKIIIGGDFTQVNGTTRNRIARLLSTGALDTTYNPNANESVNALVIDGSGNVIAGGAFTNIGGSNRSRVARLSSATGSADSFNPNAGGEVFALAIEADGSVLIGGSFTSLGGSTRRRIARVNSSGAVQSFDPNFNESSTSVVVRGIAVASDGKVYLGGLFNTLTGTGLTTSITRNRLARVNSDGTVDKTFGVELNAEVQGLRMLSSGQLAVWGSFTQSLATPNDYLVRIGTDGEIDETFVPAPNQGVSSLVETSGGKLLVGGSFSNIGNRTQHWIGRLNADGTGDAAFSRQVDNRGQHTALMPLASFTGNTGGFPAIAYHDVVKGDLRFVRASNINGTAWEYSQSLSTNTTNVVGTGISMEMVNIGGDVVGVNTSNSVVAIPSSGGTANSGTPAIAYNDSTSGDLKYVLAYDQEGSYWTAPVTIQSGVNAGRHISLKLVNGFPAVAYFNGSALAYARATTVSGMQHNLRDAQGVPSSKTIATVTFTSTWGSPQVVDSNGVVGQFPSLAIVNGQPTTALGSPAISYYDVTHGDLKYVRSSTADGLPTGDPQDPPAWGVPVTVQSVGNVGQNTSLFMTNGVPGIAYRDVSNGNMKFIHLSDAFGYSKLSFSGDTIMNGALKLDGSALFSPAAGTLVTLNGQITGEAGLRLVSEGTLLINSSNNSFGSGLTGEAPVVIRSGSLHLGNNTALGSSAVDLGDPAPGPFIRRDASGNEVASSAQVIIVDRATTGSSMIKLAGRFDATHNGNFSGAGGPGAFVEVDTTIDGRTFSVADIGTLILVKDEEGNPAWNGVYRVEYNSGIQPDGTMNLVRAPEMDELVEFAYGVQVRVSNGTHAGKAYFLANRVTDVNVSPVLWERDVVDGALALRANTSGLTIANAIQVNARAGAGSMTLGTVQSVTTGTVTFSGPITLQDNQSRVSEVQSLNLDSSIASGYGTLFTGVISEERGVSSTDAQGALPADVLSIVKTGSGVATLTGNNTFHGGVNVNQGTLLVMNTTGSATGSGLVTVNAGAALGGTGIIGGAVSLVGTGSDVSGKARLIVGDPTKSSDPVETLTINGALNVGANSVVEFTLGANNFTKLAANSVNLTETGRLLVSLGSGFNPNLHGTEFDILDTSSLTFTAGSGVLLSQYLKLPGQFTWDTSSFLSNGIIRITGTTIQVGIPSGGQPAPATVNPLSTVNFTVTVLGSPDFVYQWQKSVGGGIYVNVGSEVRSSTTTNTLTLPSVTEADEALYRVVITNGEGLYSMTSNAVQLLVNDLPAIVQQPTQQTVNPGPTSTATFTVVVSGPSPYTFQWRRGTVNVPNDARFVVNSSGNTSTLTISNISEADDRADYNVIVSNSAGAAPVSNFVRLFVNDPVVITTQPSDLTVSHRDPATFTVQHTGTAPFTYQWQRDSGSGFVDIPNATSQTLVVPEVLEEDSGDQFRVIVGNMLPSVTSSPATLTVLPGFPSVLDNPISATLLEGDTLQLTAKIGGAANGRKLQWKRNNANIREGSSTSAGVTSVITIEETPDGTATISTLTITNVTTRFGGAYALEAKNVNGKNKTGPAFGQIAIVNDPQLEVVAQAGKTASMSVKAVGPRGVPILYQWRKNGVDIDPADTRITGAQTKTLKFKDIVPADEDTYTCLVTAAGTAPDNEVVGGTHYLKVYTEAPQLILPIQFPAAMVAAAFSYQIPVDPAPEKVPTRYAASGLPPGLKVDSKTGLITGIPKAVKTGGYSVKITASNGFGSSVTAVPLPVLNVQSLPAGIVGVFAGWIPRSADLNGSMGGRFDLTIASLGSFSGKVTMGRTAYPFKGQLTIDPNPINPDLPTATVTVTRKSLLPLTLTFTLDPSNNRLASASLTDGVIASPLSFNGWRYIWDEDLNPADDYLGYHTFVLSPPEGSADEFPQGDSYAAFTVDADGRLAFAGKTADAQSITGGQFLGPNGEILMFQNLYSAKLSGSIVGQITLDKMDEALPDDNVISSTVSSAPTWTRPANHASNNRTYVNGFGPLALTAAGGSYVDPTPPAPDPLNPTPDPVDLILGLPDTGTNTDPQNATLTFSSLDELGVDKSDPSLPSRNTLEFPDDDLEPNYLGIITGNKFVLPKLNVAKTRISVVAKTGVISGGFTIREIDRVHGDRNGFLNRSTTFSGIIVKTATGMVGAGYFLLPTAPDPEDLNDSVKKTPIISGQVLLAPREDTED